MVTPNQRNTQTSEQLVIDSFQTAFDQTFLVSTRIQQVQADMTYRALELLNMPPGKPAFLLDIGCGSGLSGEILDDEGHIWAGVDVAPSMLGEFYLPLSRGEGVELWSLIQRRRRSGAGGRRRSLPSRYRARVRIPSWQLRWRNKVPPTSTFATCMFQMLTANFSISVLQWLLNAETSHPTSSPPHRLNRFFTTLFSALRNPSRAAFQFYPSSDDQIQLITSIAQKAGFGGGIVVDYPNSNKAKKVFLVLMVGSGGQVPQGLQGVAEGVDEEKAKFEKRRERAKARSSFKKKNIKDRDWVLKKKEVWVFCLFLCRGLTIVLVDSSCTVNEGKRTSHGTQNTPLGSGRLASES